MRERIGALLAAGLVLAASSSASASLLHIEGRCLLNSDDQVSLAAKVSGPNITRYKPLKWVYRARPVDDRLWSNVPRGYRSTLTVEADGNFETRFRSLFVPTDGMIYRLDLVFGAFAGDQERINRIAYYNDYITVPEDCRSV